MEVVPPDSEVALPSLPGEKTVVVLTNNRKKWPIKVFCRVHHSLHLPTHIYSFEFLIPIDGHSIAALPLRTSSLVCYVSNHYRSENAAKSTKMISFV